MFLSTTAWGQNCADPGAPAATPLLKRARTLLGETSEAYATYRDSILHIAAVPHDSVALVSDEATRPAARAAYMTAVASEPPHAVRVFVFQAGTQWLVVDPEQKNGTKYVAVLFDAGWNQKSTGNIGM